MDWKNKLEELESSAEVFNKELSWEKLYTRLQSKSASRKAIWYWIAAACLLCILYISFFLLNNKENVLVKNYVPQMKSEKEISHDVELIKKDTSTIVLRSIDKSINHLATNGDRVNEVTNSKVIRQKSIDNKNDDDQISISQINASSAIAIDTAINIVANLPVKKKIKVVHINEIGESIEEPQNVARNYEQHPLQLKFMNQESNTILFPSANKVFKNFASIKISTN